MSQVSVAARVKRDACGVPATSRTAVSAALSNGDCRRAPTYGNRNSGNSKKTRPTQYDRQLESGATAPATAEEAPRIVSTNVSKTFALDGQTAIGSRSDFAVFRPRFIPDRFPAEMFILASIPNLLEVASGRKSDARFACSRPGPAQQWSAFAGTTGRGDPVDGQAERRQRL
jgi:hypothetical protein